MSILKSKEEPKNPKKNKEELLSDYNYALNKINALKNRFENVTDPYLIEACVYELKAAQAEYSHILNRLKKESVKAEEISLWRQ